MRSLKHMLSKLASLQAVELDNFVLGLDKRGDGYIKVTELQTILA